MFQRPYVLLHCGKRFAVSREHNPRSPARIALVFSSTTYLRRFARTLILIRETARVATVRSSLDLYRRRSTGHEHQRTPRFIDGDAHWNPLRETDPGKSGVDVRQEVCPGASLTILYAAGYALHVA